MKPPRHISCLVERVGCSSFVHIIPSLASRPHCRARSAVITAEYAVRGELVLRAAAIKQEGFKGVPFDKLLECNSN